MKRDIWGRVVKREGSLQEMECGTCGKKFKFGIDKDGNPKNCETSMYGVDVWCPHCGAVYETNPDGSITSGYGSGWGEPGWYK